MNNVALRLAVCLAVLPVAGAALAVPPQTGPAVTPPASPAGPDRSIESAVQGLITDGFTANEPVVTKLGASVRKSYFIFKKPGPNGRGFFVPPLVLVETIAGKVVTHEKLGPDWGWTTIRPARSVGLGDPKSDLELREFTNGLESRIIGFADGARMQITRDGKTEPFHVRPSEGYEVELGTLGDRNLLVEITGGKTTVFALKGATFAPDAALTKQAAGGISALKTFAQAWSSRTSGLIAPKAAPPTTPAVLAKEPAAASGAARKK
jgi:hypothetical protein